MISLICGIKSKQKPNKENKNKLVDTENSGYQEEGGSGVSKKGKGGQLYGDV